MRKIGRGSQSGSDSKRDSSSLTDRVVDTCRRVFAHKPRDNQLEAILAILNGKDSVVLLPTGGKSLIFQAAAVVAWQLHGSVLLVISPLLALIQEQTSFLQSRKVGVLDCSHGKFSSAFWAPVKEGKIALVYTTPEVFASSSEFRLAVAALNTSDSRRLTAFAVDEAHCLLNWCVIIQCWSC